mmetsp:Transcript_61470/g.178243  ORF Transcript_61470/g.178243 Transcript_61470/m.178243 type:complete len:134 (-) Transcript_61470:50-451(-)
MAVDGPDGGRSPPRRPTRWRCRRAALANAYNAKARLPVEDPAAPVLEQQVQHAPCALAFFGHPEGLTGFDHLASARGTDPRFVTYFEARLEVAAPQRECGGVLFCTRIDWGRTCRSNMYRGTEPMVPATATAE